MDYMVSPKNPKSKRAVIVSPKRSWIWDNTVRYHSINSLSGGPKQGRPFGVRKNYMGLDFAEEKFTTYRLRSEYYSIFDFLIVDGFSLVIFTDIIRDVRYDM